MIATSTSGPAPFISPIKLEFSNGNPTIIPNHAYKSKLVDLQKAKKKTLEIYEFQTMDDFAKKIQTLREKIYGNNDGTEEKAKS
jgi:hypothetical protein